MINSLHLLFKSLPLHYGNTIKFGFISNFYRSQPPGICVTIRAWGFFISWSRRCCHGANLFRQTIQRFLNKSSVAFFTPFFTPWRRAFKLYTLSSILPVSRGFFRFWLQVSAFWRVYGQATKILFFLYGKMKTVSLGISNSVGNVRSMTTHDQIKPTTGNT